MVDRRECWLFDDIWILIDVNDGQVRDCSKVSKPSAISSKCVNFGQFLLDQSRVTRDAYSRRRFCL